MRVLNKHTDIIPKDAIYIGRPSIWGNPYIIGRDGTRDEVIDKYEKYILSQPFLLRSLEQLAGHDLVCFCSPKRCHGDILIRLVKAFE